MKRFVLVAVGLLGVVVLFVGAGLPLRLPREQRDLGREVIWTVIGFALAAVPAVVNWREKR